MYPPNHWIFKTPNTNTVADEHQAAVKNSDQNKFKKGSSVVQTSYCWRDNNSLLVVNWNRTNEVFPRSMKASSQEKEKRNIYLAVACRLMIKCKIKLALASKKKKEHKDAKKIRNTWLFTPLLSYQNLTQAKLWSLYYQCTLFSHVSLLFCYLIQKWWLLEETKDWRLLLKSKTYNWI